MSAVDLIIIGFALLMAVWGYSQGLIMGAFSLIGFVAGAVIGSRVGPLVLEDGARSPYAPLFALAGALMVGGLFASAFEVAAFGIRRRFGQGFGALDGAGGAALLACVGLLVSWIAGSAVLQTPEARDFRRDVQRSKILRALNRTLPPSGPVLNALARFDPLPALRGPEARVGPPSAGIVRDPDVRRAGQSVVRVLGTACGLGLEGSGWVAGAGVVVTNAHVIAGQDDTVVQLRDRSRHRAQAVVYDPRNDVAVLRASGVGGASALGMESSPGVGTSAAILGYPENGPFDARPGRLGATRTLISQDAYGRGPVRRRITALRGHVRPGNSGGPMVDASGRVVATVFAKATGDGQRSGFAVPNSIVRRAIARAGAGEVSTGPCGG